MSETRPTRGRVHAGRGVCGIGKGILSIRGQRRPATGIPREPGLANLTRVHVEQGRPRNAQHHPTRTPTDEGGKRCAGWALTQRGAVGPYFLSLRHQTPRFYRLDPPFLHRTSRARTDRTGTKQRSQTEHGRHAGEREAPPPTRKRAPLGSKPGTLQEHRELSRGKAREHRTGRACAATDQQPSPARREGGHKRKHKSSEAHQDSQSCLTRPRGPREPQREVRAGQWLGPDSRTPAFPHTTDTRWGGETRGPLAEREERSPFAMNDHSP